MEEHDLGRVNFWAIKVETGWIISPRLLMDGRTIDRTGSASGWLFIGMIELKFAEEIPTPADSGKNLCPGCMCVVSTVRDLVALHIMGVSDLMPIHPSVRKDSSCTCTTALTTSSQSWVNCRRKPWVLNRSFSMPVIIVPLATCALSQVCNSFPHPKKKKKKAASSRTKPKLRLSAFSAQSKAL